MKRIGNAALKGVALACLPLLAAEASAQPTGQAAPTPVQVRPQSRPVAPQLFGTMALPVAAKRFWDEWERARRDASTLPAMRRLIGPATGLRPAQQIAYVQSAVARSITWRSDATVWGSHDYWASAAETLSRGLGDAEDRAIVKMQALRALGFASRDLYMTLGRDKVAGPQAVLIVRHRDDYYVLDDTDAAPYPTNKRPEFTPILTFGYGASWVHARPAAKSAASAGAGRGTGAAN